MPEPSIGRNELEPGYIESYLKFKIDQLRHNPGVSFEDLFSSRKTGTPEHPNMPGVRVPIDSPVETSRSSATSAEQDLLAVIAMGEKAAVGIVKVSNVKESGNAAYYLSLVTTGMPNEGRAQLLATMKPGEQVAVGRQLLQEAAARTDIYGGVSRAHCTVEIDSHDNGVLTVVDQASTNGTTVFASNSDVPVNPMDSVGQWCQPSTKSEALLGRQSGRNLGRFVLDN